jgi:hypothetical protein
LCAHATRLEAGAPPPQRKERLSWREILIAVTALAIFILFQYGPHRAQRATAASTEEPIIVDQDKDGVPDQHDFCIDATDTSGWKSGDATDHDHDGCRDYTTQDRDRDNDGVQDTADRCPDGLVPCNARESRF